jgi:hypothetical protein
MNKRLPTFDEAMEQADMLVQTLLRQDFWVRRHVRSEINMIVVEGFDHYLGLAGAGQICFEYREEEE